MKTEKEIRGKRKELNDKINLSDDARRFGEGIELSQDVLLILISRREVLDWVLDEDNISR